MKFALATFLAGASANTFPGFSSLHAHCELEFTTQSSCADTLKAFDATMNKWSAGGPSKGLYAKVQE